MTLSERTNWNVQENDLAAAVRKRRGQGNSLLDLTVSNPTQCGFEYGGAGILAPFANPAVLQYQPDPLGMVNARTAIRRYYLDAGADVSIDRICLTTSTSEAYSFLFRLLCNPGDEILAARPCYPLFDYIAQLGDVQLREYPLLYDPNTETSSGEGWTIDLFTLQAAITAKTRAIIVVHPNNPTGNFASKAERQALEAICVKHGLALIVDEVFLDYSLRERERSFTTGDSLCPTFVLSGISKVCGLPQMKVSWIAACGPSDCVDQAMERIEVIADTFLSMNSPVQFALPNWLANRHDFQRQVIERMRSNLGVLDERLRGTFAQRFAIRGGWTIAIRVPRTVDGTEFVQVALDRGVLVQPGHFYGMGEGRAILSLLTPPEIWASGLALLPID